MGGSRAAISIKLFKDKTKTRIMETIKSQIFKLEQSKKELENLISDFDRFDCPIWVKKVKVSILGVNTALKELNSIVNSIIHIL